MDEQSPRLAIVGDRASAEMSPLGHAIPKAFADWTRRDFRTLQDLIDAANCEGFHPELVLVCQSWRDEYSLSAVRKCLGTFPVARWVCVSGPWCESEGRHGSHWPIAARVSLDAMPARLATEAKVVKGETPALALTADRDELFAFQCEAWPDFSFENQSVVISSPDHELRDWLSDLCRQHGLEIWDKDHDESATVAIIDLDPLAPETRERLSLLKQEHPRAKVLGLMGMATQEDRRITREWGADALLGKLTSDVQILQALIGLAHGE